MIERVGELLIDDSKVNDGDVERDDANDRAEKDGEKLQRGEMLRVNLAVAVLGDVVPSDDEAEAKNEESVDDGEDEEKNFVLQFVWREVR